MAQLTTLANAVFAVLPAAAVFFAAYGRYDGTFRDNVVFLYFIGGLLMGGLLGFLSLLALGGIGALVAVLLLALFYPIAMVAGINRRKWQGDRHAVFNGGAFGLGVSVMVSLSFLYRLHAGPLSFESGARALVLASGLAGLFFGLGLLAGDAVRRRVQFRVALLGTAVLFAPIVFLVEYAQEQAWLWLALLLAYAGIFAVLAERRLLIEGVADEARKQRRRIRRRDA